MGIGAEGLLVLDPEESKQGQQEMMEDFRESACPQAQEGRGTLSAKTLAGDGSRGKKGSEDKTGLGNDPLVLREIQEIAAAPQSVALKLKG